MTTTEYVSDSPRRVRCSAVAAIASYEQAYDLVRMHGESGWIARVVSLTVDGLI